MNNEDQGKFDAYETLRLAAYTSFEDRRKWEWKMCISIWAPFALYISALVTQPIEATATLPIARSSLAAGTLVISVLIIAIQVSWLVGLARANHIDTIYEHDIRNKMYEALKYTHPEKAQKLINIVDKTKGTIRHWSHRAQIFITILLGIAATIAAYARHK